MKFPRFILLFITKIIAKLNESSLTQQELLAFKRSELKEYIKLAEYLDSQYSQLKDESAVLETDWLSASLQLDQLTSENLSLQEKLVNYQQAEANWEREKDQARITLRKLDELEQQNIAKFNQTACDNARLKAQNIELNDFVAKGTKYVQNLEEIIAKKDKELTDLKIALKLSQRKEKINLLGKAVKWTTRITLPSSWANSIEIGIDAYEVKESAYPGTYELTWMVFSIIAWLIGCQIWTRLFPKKLKTTISPELKTSQPVNTNNSH